MKKYIARSIVMFLKKYKLNVHDFSDFKRDQFMWFYNLFYTEYKNQLLKIKNLEVSSLIYKFEYKFTLDYTYKNIELDINDLSWFLTRNRYFINKNCKKRWYYENLQYFFEDQTDFEKMKKIFKKTNKVY